MPANARVDPAVALAAAEEEMTRAMDQVHALAVTGDNSLQVSQQMAVVADGRTEWVLVAPDYTVTIQHCVMLTGCSLTGFWQLHCHGHGAWWCSV